MLLVQRLREIQDRNGFLPEDELRALSADTGIPLPKIQEVISFYAHFRPEWDPPPYVNVQVCRDMTCHLKGAPKLLQELKKLEREGEQSIVVEGVSCLGRCDRAPVAMCSRHTDHHHEHTAHDALHELHMQKLHEGNPYGDGDPDGTFHEWIYAAWDRKHRPRSIAEIVKIVEGVASGGRAPIPDWDYTYQLHRNCAEHHPTNMDWQIDPYVDESDRYAAVKDFVKRFPKPIEVPAPAKAPPPEEGKEPLKGDALRSWLDKANAEILNATHPFLVELKTAGLLGMGGAGVPAFVKWQDVWKAQGDEKYIVTNGDESEPGTFKDRELLLRKPHLVVEGVIMAGLMTNATRGFIFIRHEYPEQIRSVRAEIRKARAMGACGENIFGSKRNFDVDVFVSPGGYICGEQSALLEAMEDRRAQPRNRPPELMTNGLRDKPTVVNNVETLSWTPAVFRRGGKWYSEAATTDFQGRRFFSISGDVHRPGVYEVKISDTLGDLIKMAGRCTGKLKAACTSGPSGGFLPVMIPVTKNLQERMRAAIGDQGGPKKKQFLMNMVKAGLRVYGDFKEEIAFPDQPDEFVGRIAELENAGQSFVYDLRRLPLDLKLFKIIGKLVDVGMNKTPGMMLGAGIVIYSQENMPNVIDHAVNHAEFFRNESCGKCVPCRLGSQKVVQIGTIIRDKSAAGRLALHDTPTELGLKSQADLVRDMSFAMMMTSICSLGQVAANPLMSALQYFSHELPIGDRKQ